MFIVGMRKERDISEVLAVAEQRGFISRGQYRDLYDVLIECKLVSVAEGLKQKADQLFGTDNW